jgi:hypothetical protein
MNPDQTALRPVWAAVASQLLAIQFGADVSPLRTPEANTVRRDQTVLASGVRNGDDLVTRSPDAEPPARRNGAS